jgi:hypothetical protein
MVFSSSNAWRRLADVGGVAVPVAVGQEVLRLARTGLRRLDSG